MEVPGNGDFRVPARLLAVGMGCGMAATLLIVLQIGPSWLLWPSLGLMFSVSNLAYALLSGEFPIALGVLYDDPRPTFEAAVMAQNAAASEGKTADLSALLKKGQTWQVEKQPRIV